MQQLILNIEDKSLLPTLEEILNRIEGISIAGIRTKRKSRFERAMEESIADYEAGRYTEWESVDQMFDTLGLR